MKIKYIISAAVVTLSTLSCTKYLDVVPDNTLKLENIFDLKEDAWNALAKVYSYMPQDDKVHLTYWTLGDEWIGRLDLDNATSNLRAMRIMRGLQSQTSPQLGTWSGTQGGKPLYEGIRQTDVFLANIDKVRDMSQDEKRNWSAQVKFMKAYYCFLLLRQYGPIIIPQKMITPEATRDELFLPRATVEEVFDFILGLIDESMPDLKERSSENDLGQVDQIAAKAIKARILLYRASPFFNGNREFYDDFYTAEGKHFFPVNEDREKWKSALDAVNDAIQIAEDHGIALYRFDKEPFLYDRDAFEENPDKMQTLYDLRMLICDPWNKELVWAYSNIDYYADGGLSSGSNIRLPEGYGDGVRNTASFSWQWLGATYQMAERFYTANGLPLQEDLTYDMNLRHEIVETPGVMDEEYRALNGYMQPGAETINLYLNREPRFYANLGITGGFWRAHGVRINTKMFANSDGGFNSSINATDFLATGIGVQKFVHPESQSGGWQRTIKFPYPIIRMADLYLMRAEIMNEYYGPSPQVYEDINKIRNRAGIPDVETVWSDPSLTRTVNKHLTKEGLRDIILEERAVEFAFEGIHFWDMWRYKRASQRFSSPIWGWTHTGATANTFFVQEVKQQRRFTVTDYLWPIDLNEMNTNSKLIQNPGW